VVLEEGDDDDEVETMVDVPEDVEAAEVARDV